MGLTLTILIIFATVTGAAAGYYALTGLLTQHSSLVKRRVEEEFRKGQEAAPRQPLFKSMDAIDLGQFPALSADAEAASFPQPASGLMGRLQGVLEQADLDWQPRQVLLYSTGLGLMLGVVGMLFRGPLVGLPAAAAGTAAPLLYVLQKRRARREAFLVQLPAVFELMARVIRTGQSVPQALQAVANSFDGPVAREFLACQKQQNLGLRPEIAFREMAERTDILEMRIFVMAMLINRQVGGNLSDVLERLAGLMRARLRLRKQVRTLTAEGRLQGLTLLVLPILMFGVMMVINRTYAESLFEHPSLLVGMGLSMTVGILWIRKIVNIDI